MQNLKKIIGEKEVVIILDRHPGLLRSVPEIFGEKNHVYCYRHLKENFSGYFIKHNTKGNKGKENELEWLDKIAYAKVHTDYNYHMFKLRKYNDSLAALIEQNEPEH